MIEIKTENIRNCTIAVPGSKSYTHRLLIASALSDGQCTIKNYLKSEDTLLTLNALRQMGVKAEEHADHIIMYGKKGVMEPSSDPIFLANSGTSMRLLTGLAAIGKGTYLLTGSKRMLERPIHDLLEGLNQINIPARSVNGNGCPPVEIKGGIVKGGNVSLKCNLSSQYLSSLLLIAPYTREGLSINISEGPVSKPYIDMTVDIMEMMGVSVKRHAYERFEVSGGQIYKSGSYMVESDCSQAGYFWAAAAITGATIKVKGVSKQSRQGDIRFAEVLKQMGCVVSYETDGISVSGGELSSVDVDMSDMPDIVPTLAVVAAFARGTTVITNVAHLKEKESDRLGAVATELNRMNIKADVTDSGLRITGGRAVGAAIDTYNDHRIAMSFAVAGLVVPGVVIKDEACVEKSFPEFWNVFNGLYYK